MVLLVAAEPEELAGVWRRCARRERLAWPLLFARRGELNGQRVVLAADGMGGKTAVGVLKTACEREEVDAVVSAGWCGALQAGLEAGEILVAAQVEAGSGAGSWACALPRAGGPYRTGRLVTLDRLARTAPEKARQGAGGAAAVDLEAAWLAAEAARRGLRFYCVRVVLDTALESFGLDFDAARGENGRLSRPKIVRAALARPVRGLPELAHWAWRSRVTARALGDFLAECTFEF